MFLVLVFEWKSLKDNEVINFVKNFTKKKESQVVLIFI